MPGRLVRLEHRSEILRDNPLGDPYVRELQVWLPPGYEDHASKRYPVLYDLVGYTAGGPAHTNWRNFDENVPERAARLIAAGVMAPAILVFPDCFTALGGNQYINSSALGRYADYLCHEIVPFVDQHFRTLASRDSRGCFGKSSGGYGAMIHGMKYPNVWGAIANHSGDAHFDLLYRSDWPNTLTELQKYRQPSKQAGRYRPPAATGAGLDDGRVRRFLEAFWQNDRPGGQEIMCLMNLAMAASYDPDPTAPNGFRLPFELDTGEIIPARWKRWLQHDPIYLVKANAKRLQSLRGIYIDCGWRDQYHIHFGSRILSRELSNHGVKHRYEEFNGTHSGIDHRMDISLPFLTRVLKKR